MLHCFAAVLVRNYTVPSHTSLGYEHLHIVLENSREGSMQRRRGPSNAAGDRADRDDGTLDSLLMLFGSATD